MHGFANFFSHCVFLIIPIVLLVIIKYEPDLKNVIILDIRFSCLNHFPPYFKGLLTFWVVIIVGKTIILFLFLYINFYYKSQRKRTDFRHLFEGLTFLVEIIVEKTIILFFTFIHNLLRKRTNFIRLVWCQVPFTVLSFQIN
jgi:hypothetical protein